MTQSRRRSLPMLLAAAMAMAALPTLAAPSDAAADQSSEQSRKSYTYQKGKVINMQSRTAGGMKIWVNRGHKHKIYAGSTGVFYRGGSNKFLKDHEGTTIRFRVIKVKQRECVAVVTQGKINHDTISANRRVVLRRRR